MIRLVRSTAALIMVVALAACGGISPPSPQPQPQLSISLPIPTTDKAVIDAAITVMSDRLRTLGVGTFASSAGSNLTFTIPFDGTVDQAEIEAVLREPGVVRFVGWGLGDGNPPSAGDPEPIGTVPIFDAATEITSAAVVKMPETGDTPSIEIALDPAGTAALAAWTADHIGDYVVIVADGTVLESPVVAHDIPDGHVVLSFPRLGKIRPDVVAAVMASGPLPARWINP